ncbi:minor tail protein [Mycobacterium phage SuperGrey]|uniref:Minor tail protein n=1 Tax=Mycobacterium phage SuperGrey TaxID=1913038 RepID=A0A1J0GPL2_9CAUD|nr:minor tail protein [Mycobacterium phage SuperGrey]APC43518.1 minor tail protein [Mycobacterium phage SuperGrey]
MSVAVGWWAESHVSFGVTITPEVGFHYGGPKQEFGVTLTPEIGMSAVAHNRASFGLSVPVSLGMAAASHSKASFGLVFAPYIAMRGPAAFEPVFPSEDLYPSVSLFPTPRAQTPGFGLSFTPSLGFEAAPKFARSFGIELDPQVGMGTALGFTKGFGLELSPQVGMSGAERYYREFELTLTPGIGMDAVGNDGVDPVAFDAVTMSQQATSTFSFNHTATSGASVLVSLVVQGSDTIASVTYDGSAMTLIGSQALNNNAGEGSQHLYVIHGVAGGSKQVTVNKPTGFGWVGAVAASYLNATTTGTVQKSYGNSGSASLSASAPGDGGRVVVSFANMGNRTFTPSGGTNRFSGSGLFPILTISDATTATNFTATSSSGTWAAMAVPLNPV